MSLRWGAMGAAAGLTFMLAVLASTAASAHAVLLRVTPSGSETLAQAPAAVQLLFSEPIDPVFSSAQVFDAAGSKVDNGDGHVDPNNDQLLIVSLPPGLPNGVYTVVWRNLSSIDVHPDEGQYRLFVGVPVTSVASVSAPPITATPETTLGRWWFYVAASLFGGVLAAWKFVFSRVLVGAQAELRATVRRRAYRLVLAGGVLLLLGTVFTAVAQAAAAANVSLLDGVGKPLADLLLRGRFATIWWPRTGLELASVLLIAFGGLEDLASECALATLPAVLLTSALTSHGAALPEGPAPGIAIDWLHIVGATAWVGGLIALFSFLPVFFSSTSTTEVLRPLVERFGRFALVASMVVLLSGVLQGALEVGSPSALLDTLYGQLVLLKVGLLALMLLLALFNEWNARRVSTPFRFRRGVRVEMALGVFVFAVAAMLSGTPPSPTG